MHEIMSISSLKRLLSSSRFSSHPFEDGMASVLSIKTTRFVLLVSIR